MKKLTPLFIVIGLAAVLFGGWWYEHSTFQTAPEQPASTSSSTLTGKAVSDAADAAEKYRAELKTYGKVPLNTTGLPRNPSPLFGAKSGQ